MESGTNAYRQIKITDGRATIHQDFPSESIEKMKEEPSDSSCSLWTAEEDKLLKELTDRFGTSKWSFIASMIPNKTNRQCRRRWQSINSTKGREHWTVDEDLLLYKGFKVYGHRWTEIAKMIPGRTDNATKNRFSSILRQLVTFKRRKLSNTDQHSKEILKMFAEALSHPLCRQEDVNSDVPSRDSARSGHSRKRKQGGKQQTEYQQSEATGPVMFNRLEMTEVGDGELEDRGEVSTSRRGNPVATEQGLTRLAKKPRQLIDLNLPPHGFDLNFPPPEIM